MIRTLLKSALAAAVVAAPLAVFTANHREAPITALDRAADITDWYSFVSYDDPSKLTMILSVDPLLEPSNGPNYFPFDPEILYEMKVDNDQDAVEDVILQFRFQTEQRIPGVFTGFVGGLLGIPPITALDGPGSEGLGSRQSYTVTAIRGNRRFDLSGGRKLFAVPSNVGPRTMPNYQALYDQGIYDLGNGIRVFAGTTDDPFYIDLGAAFDSLNFRPEAGGGVLSQADDDNNAVNVAADDVSGFNVNTIAIEIPIRFLTRDLRPTPTPSRPPCWAPMARPRGRRSPCAGGRAKAAATRPARRSGRCSAWATRSSTSSSSAPGRRIGSAWTTRPTTASSWASSPSRCSPTSSSRSACRCRPARAPTWRCWCSTPGRRFRPPRARVQWPTCCASTPAFRPRPPHSSSASAC